MTQKTENTLHAFERKVLRRIFGPIQENGRWRLRWNKELYDINIVEDIKIKKLRWADHGGGKSAKKSVEWQIL